MKQVLTLFGNTAGVLGVLVCLISAVVRLAGANLLLGHDPFAFFTAGIGLMVAGCLAKLQVLGMAPHAPPRGPLHRGGFGEIRDGVPPGAPVDPDRAQP